MARAMSPPCSNFCIVIAGINPLCTVWCCTVFFYLHAARHEVGRAEAADAAADAQYLIAAAVYEAAFAVLGKHHADDRAAVGGVDSGRAVALRRHHDVFQAVLAQDALIGVGADGSRLADGCDIIFGKAAAQQMKRLFDVVFILRIEAAEIAAAVEAERVHLAAHVEHQKPHSRHRVEPLQHFAGQVAVAHDAAAEHAVRRLDAHRYGGDFLFCERAAARQRRYLADRSDIRAARGHPLARRQLGQQVDLRTRAGLDVLHRLEARQMRLARQIGKITARPRHAVFIYRARHQKRLAADTSLYQLPAGTRDSHSKIHTKKLLM